MMWEIMGGVEAQAWKRFNQGSDIITKTNFQA